LRRGLGAAAFALALGIAACTSGASAGTSLTIYAAASLKTVLVSAEAAFETTTPGVAFTTSTDSSAALETKIEQGAPADVFLSADASNPQKLVEAGLAAGGLVTFAANVLVVIVPSSNPAGIRSPADLAKAGVKVIAAADSVPISGYAKQLVANLAKEPGYPASFASAYSANIVSKEDNVAAIVAKIELCEGDAGIVYATDAKSSTKVTTIPVPDAANVLATYAGVVVKTSANVAAAEAFVTWLAGPDGQAIFARFGFLPPP
jgi:molybdate transport system substrate-binding protein